MFCEDGVNRVIGRRPAHIPEIEGLQRGLSRLASWRLGHEAPSRRFSKDASPRGGNDRYNRAISSAAAADSRPLLAGPSPARAIASSAVFVVNTPNATGTPVACEARMMPSAAALAM